MRVAVGEGPTTVPAGWYPDPADSARLRRWDGARWTQDVVMPRQPAVPSPPTPQAAPQPVAQPVAQPAPQQAPPVQVQTAPPIIIPQPAVIIDPQQSYSPSAPQPAAQPAAAHAAPPFIPGGQDAPPFATPDPPEQRPSGRRSAHAAEPNIPSQPAPGPATPPLATPVPPSAPPTAPPPPPAQVPPVTVAPTPVQPQAQTPPASSAPNAAASQPDAPTTPVDPSDWAHMPGLTLPPDLSAIPGFGGDTVLPMPRMAEPVRELTPPESVPGYYPPPPQPAGQYAPPPSGFHYDVPPPPGASNVANDAPSLPASALPPRMSLPPANPQLPPDGSMMTSRFDTPSLATRSSAPALTQGDYVPMARSSEASLGVTVASGTSTLGVWLIGLLPLLHFAIVYAIFGVLEETLIPGIQWAILLGPSILALVFAAADRRALITKGHGEVPSAVFAFIPPLYLLVRCFRVGLGSIGPLVAWVVLQAAAVAGAFILLPTLVSAIAASF